jgi:hypothetical protein
MVSPPAISWAAPEGVLTYGHMIEISRVVHYTQIDEGISSHHPQLCPDTALRRFRTIGPSDFDYGSHDFARSMNRN